MRYRPFFLVIYIFIIFSQSLFPEQINIERIDQMPDLPQPYDMRNWRLVALRYDSLVFNLQLSGEYLPLIWIDNNGVNYPEHSRFGLHSYVGSFTPGVAEAINQIPAVIGATLCGLDKSNQGGYNFVEMCEEFFNRRPEENIYLNNFVGNSGGDWWYDTMPNLFFYQLYWLYPDEANFQEQFSTIAERWLEALEVLGGSTTPWSLPDFHFRGFRFATMQPNPEGVHEPEAAGAIGWLLYMAYRLTGEETFRIGAEWSLEFLNSLEQNPAYELQLPYGVYLAARMNAELGTAYDVEKLLNWCFTPEDNVRQWGVTLGNWGGYDCAGLVGEALYDGYAFFMNGVQQAAALVPMLRYDDRFARAIGKWVLNLANASRLFYSNFLPAENQDSEEWSFQYDTNSVIAHEALREFALYSGLSPFATGDAIANGWAATNLALYGSSHVGYLGALIEKELTTGILLINCQATDFFSNFPYPLYLIYNPYQEDRSVEIVYATTPLDVYDLISNQFILTGVSDTLEITVPADYARLIALLPSGSEIVVQDNQLWVDGVCVDYNLEQPPGNYPPRIKSLAADHNPVLIGNSTTIFCTAEDRDGDSLVYRWIVPQGDTLVGGETYEFTAPYSPGEHLFQVLVDDGEGDIALDSVLIVVSQSINQPPRIRGIDLNRRRIEPGDTTFLSCEATDPNGDQLTYIWYAPEGAISTSGSQAIWNAPDRNGDFWIYCRVEDSEGADALDSVVIFVRSLQMCSPVLCLPFKGDFSDSSRCEHDVQPHGVYLTEDRLGNPAQACAFDGIDDFLEVENDSCLNFRNGITLSFWMKILEFYNREQYPISHGNWENRWKVSITPERHIRWTIRTTSGIKDLDNQQLLELERDYMVTCVYDGENFQIYIDGEEEATSTWSGQLRVTDYNLTIGQVLPNVSGYNFHGVLDEIQVYDYPLTNEEISELYYTTTAVKQDRLLPQNLILRGNFPNPFNATTIIGYYLPRSGEISLFLYDLRGRELKVLRAGYQKPGWHEVLLSAEGLGSGIYLYTLQSGDRRITGKCVVLK